MQVRNSVTLIGNVGQAPTANQLPSGTRVVEFSLATNDYYRDKNGNRVTRTEWHRIKAFGKVGEVLERHVTKGTALAVTGSIRYGKWTDKYDQQRTTTDIILNEFTFIGGRQGSEYDTAEEATAQVAEPAPTKTAKRRKKATAKVTPAEDLPF